MKFQYEEINQFNADKAARGLLELSRKIKSPKKVKMEKEKQ